VRQHPFQVSPLLISQITTAHAKIISTASRITINF
jgi:hypothetical protein